jgi:hypothetical protein
LDKFNVLESSEVVYFLSLRVFKIDILVLSAKTLKFSAGISGSGST